MCMRVFTGVLNWPVDEVQAFLTHVRAELKVIRSKKIHAQYT